MNKTLIGIFSFFIVGIVVGSQLRGCRNSPCAGVEVTHIKRDTVVSYVYGDTAFKQVKHGAPLPYRVADAMSTVNGQQPNADGRQAIAFPATSHLSPANCLDTAYYADSLRWQNDCKAIITDTVLGRIIGRSVQWAGLRPTEVKTITNTVTLMKKQALVKAYLGADAYCGSAAGKYNIDVAPAASLVFADRYMVDLGYYILNRQVTAGVKVKLSFRK
jgi:hypothetical protein